MDTCTYNQAINCNRTSTTVLKCQRCGWNPRVAAARQDEARKKILKAVFHEPARKVFVYAWPTR